MANVYKDATMRKKFFDLCCTIIINVKVNRKGNGEGEEVRQQRPTTALKDICRSMSLPKPLPDRYNVQFFLAIVIYLTGYPQRYVFREWYKKRWGMKITGDDEDGKRLRTTMKG